MRHTTHGNSRPWEVATGYQYSQRNPAPIQSTDAPLNYRIIVGGPAFAMMLWGIGDVLRGVL